MAAATNYTQSVQKMYDMNLTAYSKELKGQGLKSAGTIKTADKGDTITFYRRNQANTGTGAVPSMYGDSAQGNNGGKPESYVATIAQIWAQQKVAKTDMNKTGLDIKGGTIASIGDEILRAEDKVIMTAINASSATTKKGDVAKEIDDDYNIRTLIQMAKTAKARASASVAGRTKPALLAISLDHYEKICANDIFINGDYKNSLGSDMNFFGTQVRITPQAAAPTIIPPDVFGWGEWEGSMENTAEYMATDGQTWHIQSVKSGGVVLIEPDIINILQFKPPVAP